MSGLLAGSARTAAAEPAAPAVRSLRLSADTVLPFEGWAEVAGVGLGGSLQIAVHVGDDLAITARAGVVPHLAVDRDGVQSRVLEAPVLGGARLEVARFGAVSGFTFGEVGIVAVRTTATIAGISAHDSDLRFASALGGGVSWSRFDLSIAAWLADLGDLDHGVGVTLSLGARVARW